MRKTVTVFIFLFILNNLLLAQDYVNVTFRHYPTVPEVIRAFVPGTFNNWGPNLNSIIAPDAPSKMEFIDSLGYYVKTVRLIAGNTYEYKFHEHRTESGDPPYWITDPLNPLINFSDNKNSILQSPGELVYPTPCDRFSSALRNDRELRPVRPAMVSLVFFVQLPTF